MKYKSLAIGIILIAVLFIILDSSTSLRLKTKQISNSIQQTILNWKDSIANSYNRHFNQAREIKELQATLKDYEKIKLELLESKKDLDSLALFDTQETFYNDSRFMPARAHSYVGMGDYNSVWLDFDISGYSNNKMFGMVQNGNALGVAVIESGALKGLINGESRMSYAVFIGENKTPSIIRSYKKNTLLADFIQPWQELEVGQIVETSGLDGIFISGILVGEIIEIIENEGYKSAVVKPYANSNLSLDFVWLIDTNKEQQATFKDGI